MTMNSNKSIEYSAATRQITQNISSSQYSYILFRKTWSQCRNKYICMGLFTL